MVDRSLPVPEPEDELSSPPAAYTDPVGAPADYPPVWDDEDEGFDWRRSLSAIARHKLLVVSMLLVGLAAGLLAYQLLSPTYGSTASVWIDQRSETTNDQEPIRPRQLLQASGWIDLMRSYVVMDPVVHEMSLYVRPDEPEDRPLLRGLELADQYETGRFALLVSESGDETTLRWEGETVETAPVGSPIGASVGFRWTPPDDRLEPGRTIEFTVDPPRDAARELAESLDIQIDGNGTFLRVTMQGADPQLTTDVVNAIVDRYVTVAEDLKRAQTEELTSILEEQLAYAEENLREAELELENFKVQTISLPSEPSAPVAAGLEQTQDPAFSNFFDLRVEQEELRQDRLAIERALAQSEEQGRMAVEALEVIPAVRESSDIVHALELATEKRAELRALRQRYTDEHPDVRQLTEDLRSLENETIPALVEDLRADLASRQSQVEGFADEASQELREIPQRAIEEARLERRYDSAEELFRELQSKHESARLAAASTIADVRVLDQAQVPSTPESDPRARFLAFATLAGLGLGLLGAVVRDRADSRLRYPEQVTRELGLPILGAIPHVRGTNGRMHHGDQEQVVEAFRNLRLAVTYAHGGGIPLVLTVTSPGVGDGKSFCTSNLALAFAELGHDTIVVDGDVRRGGLHVQFASERKPGLTDLLADDAALEDAIRETSHPRLSILPSGTRFRDGPELLGTSGMQDIGRALRSRFDVILIDSPPMGAAVDPYLLATMSGSLLIVLRNGTTDRLFAGAKLSDLTRLPVRLLGAVLNDVPSKSGPYRYYSYLPGYGVSDEGRAQSSERTLVGRK